MKLNIQERLALLNVLPRQGDFTTLKLIRELRESLSFSEEEHKNYQFREDSGRVFWNPEKEQLKEVHIGDKMKEVIVAKLEALNKAKKLEDEQFTLYEKFVGGTE